MTGSPHLTHVEFRSSAFPPYESEFDEINPGRYGKRLAEYLAAGLRREGEIVGEPGAEDWGWIVPVAHDEFRLWIGVGNYDEYNDGFLCFIEPHTEYVRRWFKKVHAAPRIALLRSRMEKVLQARPDIRDVKWWTCEEFMHPTPDAVTNPPSQRAEEYYGR